MPAYNRAPVLPRAIESVLKQTESDFELILVDDGSTDGTPQLLATIEDPRIRVVRSDVNRGGNWARNRGVEHARAELVAFLDSDDVYFPDKLAVVLALFSANPQVDVWLDSFVCRDARDRGKPEKQKINQTGCSGVEFRAGLFQRTIAKATTAMSMRKSALFEVGLFDETLRRRQDLDVILRLSKGHVCMTTDRILWAKYETADGISRDARTFLNAVIAICDRHPDYLRDYPAALYRDLRSHFSKLFKQKQWKILWADIRRYRAYRPFEVSFPRLLLDRGVIDVATDPGCDPGCGERGNQEDSAQRSLNESGTPSKIAEMACADARQKQ
jgi:glycosyltransferase involved in cell wall biosynthesis